ncbi:MAG: helix-hairpin-helix domain-containing protein [Thermodesulfobacteriota bacterium]|nr:helix-hairpin-helix domain-containing protein [Thermodesulfobacteriota bacterium]
MLLALLLTGLGWLGNWWGPDVRVRDLGRVDRVWIEVAGPGVRARSFPSQPTLTQVLQSLGIEHRSGPVSRKIQDGTRVMARRFSMKADLGPMSEGTAFALGRKMDLNRAGARDLALLPGVGPVTARRIAADRAKNGPFFFVDDVIRVKGVGLKKLEKIRPLVTVGASSP